MDIRQRIVNWSQAGPLWRQDLLRRVAASEASHADCAEVLELLLKEKGLTDVAPTARPLQLEDLPEETPRSPEVLVEIGRCANVNSIQSEDPLTFDRSGITLVYGHNAAGKSSYARALKSIARAAHRETVLPNVFSTSAAREPQAVVEVEADGTRAPHIVSFASPQLVLPSTTVFDGRCAGAYLGSRRKLEFTPIPLLLFGRAASAQQKLQELVDTRITALQQRRPDLEAFPQGTRVRQVLDSAASVPTPQELCELATVSDEEREELAQLRSELAAAEADAAPTTIARLRTSAAQMQEIASDVDAIAAVLSTASETELRLARERVQAAREAVELARGQAFADEPLRESGSDGWKVMWSAARTFVVEECGHAFPPLGEGEVCPLCQQLLAPEARDRLRRFKEFIAGTVEEESDAADSALARLLEECSPSQLPVIPDSLIESLGVELPETAQSLRDWLDNARERSVALQEGAEPAALPVTPSDQLRERAQEQFEAATRLERTVADPAQVAARQREADELVARIALEPRLDEMITWSKNAAAIRKLDDIRDTDLATTAVSTAFGNLARDLVNQELRDAIKQELTGLRFSDLKVDLSYRTERGEATAQMGLDGTSRNDKLSDVLSESEQRACALAFFLAEALMSDSQGTVILDDPASSFDAERIEHISRRIVELAKKRKQVIVFTHHIPFGWALQETAKQESVPFAPRLIDSLGGRTGIVRNKKAWPGERLKGRIGMLKNDLQRIEALERRGEIDAYEREARTLAADIRIAWEHAVEEVLFGGAVMRFQRNVKAQNIQNIVVTPTLTKEVLDGMNETNPFHHAEAAEAPTQTPKASELRSFLARLEDFAALVKQERDGASGASVPAPARAADAPGAA